MRTITIYESDDGTQFDNKIDCIRYELKKEIEGSAIKLIGYNNELLSDPESDETYNSVKTVIVSSEADVNVIKNIYDYSGFYGEIDSPGSWTWNDENQKFIKVA